MKTKNKLIGSLAISLLAQLASPAQAMIGDSERAEVQDALAQCHSALRARYDNPQQHRIYQRPATSIKSQQVTFWINSATQENGKPVQLKSRCVSSYQGEAVSLTSASGHWN